VPSVVPDPKAIRPFASEAAFEAWLAKNHALATEVWIKIFKKASGRPTIDPSQAIDVCLCWGWIDGIRKPFDDEAFLQRYTPRRGKSRWSQVNVERVARLTKAGRMTPHGQLHVDAAKADGRWAAAYPASRGSQLPSDFLAACAKKRAAQTALQTLSKTQAFAIAYRLHHVKSAERRAQHIERFVSALVAGEPPVPAASRPPKSKAPAKRAAKSRKKIS
jgi:uncharacterized protein YdeI (YjbR/CyaY-like superfamily)